MSIFDGALLQDGFSFIGPLSQDLSPSLSHFSPSLPQNDLFWMHQALREAQLGLGISNPNPAVGCICVGLSGREYARGHTQRYRGWHAERDAWSRIQASGEWMGTVYVTLEPCSHFGYQPPCVELLCDPRVKRVVIGSEDLNPKVSGQGIEKLRAAGKAVEVGLLRNEIRAWNFLFFAFQLRRRLGMSVIECRTTLSEESQVRYIQPLLSQYDLILFDPTCLQIQGDAFPSALCLPLDSLIPTCPSSPTRDEWLQWMATEEVSQKLNRPFQSVALLVKPESARLWLESENTIGHSVLQDVLQDLSWTFRRHPRFQLLNTFSMGSVRIQEHVERRLIASELPDPVQTGIRS